MIYGNIVRQYENSRYNDINNLFSISAVNEADTILESIQKESDNYRSLLEDSFLTEDEREILEAKYEVIQEAVGAAMIAAIIAAIGALIGLMVLLVKFFNKSSSTVTEKLKENLKKDIDDKSKDIETKHDELKNINNDQAKKNKETRDRLDATKSKREKEKLEKELRDLKRDNLERELDESEKILKAAKEVEAIYKRGVANINNYKFSSESINYIVKNAIPKKGDGDSISKISTIFYSDYINKDCVKNFIKNANEVLKAIKDPGDRYSEDKAVELSDKLQENELLNKEIFQGNVPQDKMKLDVKDIMLFLYKREGAYDYEKDLLNSNNAAKILSLINKQNKKSTDIIEDMEKDLKELQRILKDIKLNYFDGRYGKPGTGIDELEYNPRYKEDNYDYSKEINDKKELLTRLRDEKHDNHIDDYIGRDHNKTSGKTNLDRFVNAMIKINNLSIKKLSEFTKIWSKIEQERFNKLSSFISNAREFKLKAIKYEAYQTQLRKYGEGIDKYLTSEFKIKTLE